ncbi:hypothetical protein RvY_06847-1 [Ramazzottius varieornatus]|uniref:Receptor ligand binding region domain-containing protein n=1 Tax=Ramazzottius varieornatus TaxID=947166 RepID=A0A1D1V594_RAMVA|nr:hypothetical protein RvY_06847-1 [Ramazzottius varieornatus]
MIAPVFKSVGAKCSTVTFICHALRFSFVLGITSERRALPQVEIVSPGLQGSAALSSITLAGPAFESGVELLRMNYYRKFGVNHTFLFDNRIKDCALLQGNVQNMLAEYYYEYLLKSKTSGTNGTVVIITPGCIEALFLNQMAAGWNILLITTTSSDVIIKDKDKSPTWINTNQYPSLYYGESFYQLLKMNNWTSVFVFTDESAVVYYSFVSRQTLSLLKLKHVHATSVTYSSKIGELNFDGLLEEFSRRSRIMLVFAQPPQLRKLLLAAHSKNMTNGEHVYIATQPFDHKIFGNFTWKSGDESDEVRTRNMNS